MGFTPGKTKWLRCSDTSSSRGFIEAMIKGEAVKGIALKVSAPPVISSPRSRTFEHFLARKDRARSRTRF
jgi:hypothetical protein